MNLIRKWLSIPSGETKVESVELWEVRWTSRCGKYSPDTEPEMEVLTSLEAAQAFKAALENAFKLLRHTRAGTVVEMSKRKP